MRNTLIVLAAVLVASCGDSNQLKGQGGIVVPGEGSAAEVIQGSGGGQGGVTGSDGGQSPNRICTPDDPDCDR